MFIRYSANDGTTTYIPLSRVHRAVWDPKERTLKVEINTDVTGIRHSEVLHGEDANTAWVMLNSISRRANAEA